MDEEDFPTGEHDTHEAIVDDIKERKSAMNPPSSSLSVIKPKNKFADDLFEEKSVQLSAKKELQFAEQEL